ncbi:hypothetical protein ACFW6V_25750 [Streptomyces sp. NPDC058734]|uniref:hypothetical protein n=1 Tax=Streptomyces sp. NPDC058734 TaxID=3346615 RepID=UPI003695CACB
MNRLSAANRRTARTVFQAVLGLAAGLPLIVDASGLPESAAGVAVTLAVAGAVTRVMALQVVQGLLPRWLSISEPAAVTDRVEALPVVPPRE